MFGISKNKEALLQEAIEVLRAWDEYRLKRKQRVPVLALNYMFLQKVKDLDFDPKNYRKYIRGSEKENDTLKIQVAQLKAQLKEQEEIELLLEKAQSIILPEMNKI